MGFVSCIEDIVERYDAACPSDSFVGPAGDSGHFASCNRAFPKPTPNKNGIGKVTSRRALGALPHMQSTLGPGQSAPEHDVRRGSHANLLIGYYNRLQTALVGFSNLVKKRLFDDQWVELSLAMDELSARVKCFNAATLFAPDTQVLAEASSVGNRIDSLIDRACAVRNFLRASMNATMAEIAAIDKIKRQFAVCCTQRDAVVERDARALLATCEALDQQIDSLKEFAEACQVELTDTWFARLALKTPVQDKDGYSDLPPDRRKPHGRRGKWSQRKPK